MAESPRQMIYLVPNVVLLLYLHLDSQIPTFPHHSTETVIDEEPIKLELESDDDIPSIRRFCGGRAPLVLLLGLKDVSFVLALCMTSPLTFCYFLY